MSVVIVGGGLSGLFTAVSLAGAGVEEVLVLEREARAGGVARTVQRDGFALEPAVGSLSLPHPHLGPILERIGAEMEAAAPSPSRYVYVDERLLEIPASARALLSPVVGPLAKLRALAEPLLGRGGSDGDESLADFSRRRFGDDAGETLAWLMASGVHAGDPERLSVKAAFPMLAELAERHGSVLRGGLAARRDRSAGMHRPAPHVPVGGMSRLAGAAVGFLGNRFRGEFPVESVRRESGRWVIDGPERLTADEVVVAGSPHDAAYVLDDEIGAHLSGARMAPVVTVGMGGSGGVSVPSGFGALVGPGEGMVALGLLFESSYAPARAPDGSWMLKVIAGGATRPEVAGWDDDRLIRRVIGEVSRMLHAVVEPTFTEVVRHRPGIPQLEVGHDRWLRVLGALLSGRPGLHLTGWGYRGVGVSRLASEAAMLSGDIAERLR